MMYEWENINPREEGGGGGTPDFKLQGWWNGGKNQNSPKSLGFQTKPKESLDQCQISDSKREFLWLY